ncbi:MAG: nitroreductase family protein [Proteobacteria bacterium]|nr:nitroreductase family protein [Pseudomonadota bacterium]
MDILEAIHTRRSIRKFTDQPVDKELVTQLLQAAMAAPSAGNAQPWHFVVIEDRPTLDRIPEFHPYAAMCRQAPLAILVCGDPTLEKYPGFWVQDCSAAVQNLLLAARGLGLGAVWTGIHPDQPRSTGMRNLLNLPEHIQPLALIPVGHPDQPSAAVDRFQPTRIHHDRW